VEMNRKKSDRARTHRFLQKIDIDAASLVDVDEDRPRAAMNHRLDRWKRGERWNENFVPGTNSHRVMEHQRASGPRRTKDRFFRSDVSRQLGLECFALLSQDVPAGIYCAHAGLADFVVHKSAGKRDFFHFTWLRLNRR